MRSEKPLYEKSKSEEIYERVTKFVREAPIEVVSALRGQIRTPRFIDTLRLQMKSELGSISVEHKKSGWRYSFLYGEKELDELIRQLI